MTDTRPFPARYGALENAADLHRFDSAPGAPAAAAAARHGLRWQPVVIVSAVLAIVAGAGLSYAGLRTVSGPPAAGAQAPRTAAPAEPTGEPLDPALPGTALDPALPGVEAAGVDPAGVDPAGVDPAGVDPGVDPAGVDPAGGGAGPSATAGPESSAEPTEPGDPSDPYPAWPPGGDEPAHPGRPPVVEPPDTWQPPGNEEPPATEAPPATPAPTAEPSAPVPPVIVPPVIDVPVPGGLAYAEEPLTATLTHVAGIAAADVPGECASASPAIRAAPAARRP